MQTIAGGQINLASEFVLQKMLDLQQIEQREPAARRDVDEDVEITIGACFVPDC